MRQLTPAEVRVWLILFKNMKPDGTARTGQTDVAERTGVIPRAVKKAVKKRIERDLVKVVIRGRLGTGRASTRCGG